MDRIIWWETPAGGIATLNLDRAIREGSQCSYAPLITNRCCGILAS